MNKDKTPLPAANNPRATPGVITIRDKDDHQCHLTGPAVGSGEARLYNFSDSSPCKDDTARTLQFDDFPSATRIFLAANIDASQSTSQNFWFELITTRKRTATIIRNLENFASYFPGDIIEPGLRLLRKFRKDDNAQIRDALSSVRITAATSPPRSTQDT